MTEKHNMLFTHQISTCQKQSIKTVLNLLVNQIHEIWWNEDHVTSLLFLNITEIYNWMICDKMMHVLQIKKISEQLAEWIKAFMINRISILILSDIKTKKKSIFIEVSQEFFLSFILYLFYAAEFLKTCNSISDWLSTSVFVNDITLLIYEQIIEENCRILENVHNWYMNWAHCYRAFFALKKYDLIHLFRKFKKFNMQAQLQLENLIKAFIMLVQMLRIWLNSKLQWSEHVKIVLNKMKIQINAFIYIMIFIWNIIFVSACQIYSVIIKSALAHETVIWHLI